MLLTSTKECYDHKGFEYLLKHIILHFCIVLININEIMLREWRWEEGPDKKREC